MAPNNYTDLSMRRTTSNKGVFRTAINRMIEARERQARAYVRQNLSLYGQDMYDFDKSAPHESSAPRR